MSNKVIITVHGHVQGVCFRASAKKHAEALGLYGYARNLSNGAVEICIEGSKDDAIKLLELIKKDFPDHTISRTTTTTRETPEAFTNFIVN
ncbi:MAG: acylphosphatase [Simkaniaceae bacterium]|nr:acylphosphatase [Simkaniaceae bacterium]